jgi:hypothetical protein
MSGTDPNMHPRKKLVIDTFGKEPENLDELAHCIIKLIETRSTENWSTGLKEQCKVVGFAWKIYQGNVSNSHSAPLGGIHNFMRDKDLPVSYPGWMGRVWIRYYNPGCSPSSEQFYNTLTYPGTGGGGSYDGPWENIYKRHYNTLGPKGDPAYPAPQLCSWDYRIYMSDWPALHDDFEKQKIFDKLAGRHTANMHDFLWNDPATVMADAEFMSTHPIKKAKTTA